MEISFSRKIALLGIGLLLVFAVNFAFGQGITTGSISGTAEDQQHAVVSGATVTATQAGTNQKYTTHTGSTGYFSIQSLPTGAYNVSIEAPKFSKLTINNVVVSLGVDNSLGARILSIGTQEVVTVEDTTPLVETNSAQITTTMNARKTSSLPLGTNFDSLALLVPGAADPGDNSFSNGSNLQNVSMNGQRGRSNNFQLDGQNNNDNSVAGPKYGIENPDLISEFQVVSNNFSAEYGRNMGSVINYVTKSGSNAWHGSTYELYSGNFTDSLANQEKNPLLGFCLEGQDPTATGCTKPVLPKYVQNRFGATFGGPIKHDKAWFFMSFAGNRARQAISDSSGSTGTITPTPAGLAILENTFCGTAVTSYAPNPCPSHPGLGALLVNGPYANPVGSPSSGAPTIQTVSDGALSADVPFAVISRQVPEPANTWETSGRADWQVTSKDRIFGRYIFQDNTFNAGAGRFAAGAWVDEPSRSQNAGVDWVRNWTSNFVNQVRFNYSRLFVDFGGAAGTPFASCDVPTILQCPTGYTMLDNTTSFGYQNNLPQNRLVNDSEFQDNATWVHGRHTVKFGGEYERQRSPNAFLPNINGTVFFGSFDDLLANAPLQVSLAQGPVTKNFKEQDSGIYAQDDWRIRENLTLNLGIRWEFTEQAINLLHDLTVARESDPNQAFWDQTLPLAARTVPHTPQDLNNWGPNVGFAYTPRIWKSVFGEDKTVIRGGFRIAYDPEFYNMFLNVSTAAPTVNAATLFPAALPAGSAYTGAELNTALQSNFPRGLNPGIRNFTTISPNFHNPYAEQYSFGVERQVTSHIAAEVRYVGNHTVGNFQSINQNPRIDFLTANFPSSVPAGLTPCTAAQSIAAIGTTGARGRIDCTHTRERLRANTAFSIYNGLQTRLDFQNWHGLNAGLSYTYSRTIDNVSEIFSTGLSGTGNAFAQNPFDTNRAERGVSGQSFPNVFTFYYIYDLPWYKNQQGILGHILGGWQANSVYKYQSGAPFNPLQNAGAAAGCDPSFDNSFIGIDTCRPILANPNAPLDTVGVCTDNTLADCGLQDFFSLTGAPVTLSQVHWIHNDNTAQLFFGAPFIGVPRNTLRGQTISNLDFGVFKNTKLREGLNMQLQFNALNVLNRQFRGTPDPFVDDGNLANKDTFGGGSFMNNFFNNSDGQLATGHRRRMTFGVKFQF